MSARIGDFRNYTRLEMQVLTEVDKRVAAIRAEMEASFAREQAMISAVAARSFPIDLGSVSFVVGSTVAVTTAGAKRQVIPFAGVRPTDNLFARVDEYLPDGYGLPQVMCRNAGQLEVRIVVPAIALGTTKTVNLLVTAMRQT